MSWIDGGEPTWDDDDIGSTRGEDGVEYETGTRPGLWRLPRLVVMRLVL